jgi:hypothetical protein
MRYLRLADSGLIPGLIPPPRIPNCLPKGKNWWHRRLACASAGWTGCCPNRPMALFFSLPKSFLCPEKSLNADNN